MQAVVVVGLDANGHFTDCIHALSDGLDAELVERVGYLHDAVDGLVQCIHRTVAQRRVLVDLVVRTGEADAGGGHSVVAAGNLDVIEVPGFGRLVNLVGDDGFDVGVGHHLFLVGPALETRESQVDLIVVEIVVAHLIKANAKSVPAGVFSQHQLGGRQPYCLGAHDLVGQVALEHSVLMDAGLVGECIGAHDGFVWLDDQAGVGTDHAAGAGDLGGVYVGDQVEKLGTGVDGHHHLFQRSVARSFADAIHGHFGLPRAGGDSGQRVGRGQSQVVVAVD